MTIASSLSRIPTLKPMKYLFSILLACCLPLAAAGQGDNTATGRDGFGQAPLPLWSPLTDFEIDTLAKINRARRGDPDTLLAFYVLAAGDKRHWEDYNYYRNRIRQWLDNLPAAIRDAEDPEQQAAQLLQAMHGEFFIDGDNHGNNPDNNPNPGYSLDQTQITRLFDSGYYNCISSALLYMVLAHQLGLEVNGVLMPSHAFVELVLPGGKRIDIETTSLNGFDIQHTEEFYQRESDWFTERGLAPPGYRDYLNRKIISPFQLGLEDMWSQHSRPGSLPYLDRSRLAEIRSHLQPDSEDSQINRLIFYHREFGELEPQRDFASLSRLYQKIQPWLNSLDYFPSNSAEFLSLRTAVNVEWAYTLVHTGELEQGMRLARSARRDLEDRFPERDALEKNIYLVLNEYARRKQSDNQFDAARLAYHSLEYDCVRHPLCAEGLVGLYAGWGQFFWEQQDWQNTIAVYQDYLTIDPEVPRADTINSNMEAAYLNWAGEELNTGEWETALNIYRTCQLAIENAGRCRARQEELAVKAERYGY